MKNLQTGKYILKKAVQLVLSLLVLSIIVFFVSRLAPGEPLKAYYGETVERMSQEQLAAAEERLGLNDPLIIQYADWLSNAVKGDFPYWRVKSSSTRRSMLPHTATGWRTLTTGALAASCGGDTVSRPTTCPRQRERKNSSWWR